MAFDKNLAVNGSVEVNTFSQVVFNNLSQAERDEFYKSILDAIFSKISNDYFLNLGISSGTYYVTVPVRPYNAPFYSVRLRATSSSNEISIFDIGLSGGDNYFSTKDGKYKYFVIWSSVFTDWGSKFSVLATNIFNYQFTVKPVALPSIPDPVIPDNTYNGFLKDEKLFSSFVSLVDTVLKSLPENIQSFDNSILNVVKTRTKGITLLDYYQAKIPLHETDTYDEGISVYKEMYLRVIAPSGTSVISRSIKIDWTLIQSMGYGSGILDNGVSIAGNAIIEKRKGPEGKEIETSYIRRAYTIHSNDFDIWSWINQVQKDNNYAPTLITFPDFEQINNDLSNQGNFFNGKDLQSSLKDRYNFYYNLLKSNQDVLGLSDSQIVTLANNRANADYFEYYNSKNNATMAQMATINTQIEKDRRNQELSEKKLAEEEKAREQEEKEKEKDKAIEIAKKNDKEIKKKVVEYSSKVSVMFNKYSKVDSTSKGLGLPVDISEVTGSKVFSVFISQDTVEPSLLPFN